MDKEEIFDLNDNDIEFVEVELDGFEDEQFEELDDFEDEQLEDLDEFEEDEPQPFMIAVISLGVVIALLVIICVVFFIFKSGKEDGEAYVVTTETEVELSTEAQTENSIIENETLTNVTVEETTTEVLQSEKTNVQEPVSGNESMEFVEISDTVTAKDVTNLRSVPSTLEEGNIVSQLMNGEVISRTGINEAYGWSRLDYNGQTVYAVSNYLTTDLNYKPPVTSSNPNRVSTKDGRVIIFTDYSDNVTPKEYVNLRTEPSTSEGESTVRCQIKNGDVVHRTGYSPDSGWSRVEYNGEILYVVSSMIYTTDATE